MARNNNINIEVTADTKDAEVSLKRLKSETKRTGKQLKENIDTSASSAKNLGSSLLNVKNIIGGIAGLKAFQMISKQISESISLAKVQIQAEQRLEAVVKATGGAAGFTADELKRMASGLQQVTTIGDETFLSAQAVLLTFREISGDTFPRAIEAAADLSQVLGGDLESATKQLGMALNDPITGVSRLTRSGVTFTEQQKEQIKKLVEQNKLFDAQALILEEVEKQVGGVSRALAETDVGKIQQLTNEIGDFKEEIGTQLLPVMREMLGIVNDTIIGWKGLFGVDVSNLSALTKAQAKQREETLKLNELTANRKRIESGELTLLEKIIGKKTLLWQATQEENEQLEKVKVAEKELNTILEARKNKKTGGGSGGGGGGGGGKKDDMVSGEEYGVKEISKDLMKRIKEAERLNDEWMAKQKSYSDLELAIIREKEEAKKAILDESMAYEVEKMIEKNNKKIEDEEKTEALIQQVKKDSMLAGFDAARIGADAIAQISKNKADAETQRQIENVKNSKKSEKEKEKAIEQIRAQAAKKEKRRAIGMAILNGALGATKTIANLGLPPAIPALIVQAALTAANVAVIASQKFASGGVVKKESGVPATGDQHIVRVNPEERILTKAQDMELQRAMRGNRGGVSVGDTNIVIQGNVDSGTVDKLSMALADERQKLRSELQTMNDAGLLDFLR